MLTLYPAIQSYATHQLSVDTVHTLHVEEFGNPDGIPVLFVHGGPGGGCGPDHPRYFDPNKYRIVLFDQRGAGRSTPHAHLENNTTQDLVADMENIRNYLNIDKWVLFGGSWGSTLALVYAQTHPKNVLGMIVRGIFLGSQSDVKWFYHNGANQVFPDYYQEFIAPIPHQERKNLLQAYYQRLTGTDEIAQMSAAKAWSQWEGRTATLDPQKNLVAHFSEPHFALSLARIECHYFVNNCFLKPNQILKDAKRLKNIPGIIVHGRYDMICPVKNAWDLHQKWPNSQLKIIRDAGHASSEGGTIHALVESTREFSNLFK